MNRNGTQIAFEIENIYISCNTISGLLKSLGNVKKIGTYKLFSNSEYRIEFSYNEIDCVVWEPYGDSSRYWIGPKKPESEHIEIRDLQDIFDSYTPSFLRQFIGDLFSFNFIKK